MQIQVVAPVCIKEIKTIELLRVNETYLNKIKKKISFSISAIVK